MPADDPFASFETLPDTLPDDPMPVLKAWYDEAHERKEQPNPNCFTLATVDPDGRPSARVVLCKSLELDPGCVVFYTNKRSRKGTGLDVNRFASIVFHWDHMDRQVRIEGPVTETSEEESDAYFHSRHPMSRAGVWASDQSHPIASRDAMLEKVVETVQRMGLDFDALQDGAEAEIPRPKHWGGYRVWAERVELWAGSPVRIHDRALWTRELEAAGDTIFRAGPWRSARLQP
jgi:pyridoxamine 5'-phosphate oxidase